MLAAKTDPGFQIAALFKYYIEKNQVFLPISCPLPPNFLFSMLEIVFLCLQQSQASHGDDK